MAGKQPKDKYVQRMQQVRDRLGMTQAQVAHRLGVTTLTINRWENGHAEPSSMAKVLLDKFFQEAEGYPAPPAS